MADYSDLKKSSQVDPNPPAPSVHGSPHDRGSADYYYWRPFDPHYYPNGTYNGERIDPTNGMTEEQVAEYRRGYDEAEKFGDRKDWGYDEPCYD